MSLLYRCSLLKAMTADKERANNRVKERGEIKGGYRKEIDK